MAYLHPRDWVASLPEGFDDATSFRHMRRFAQQELDKNATLRAEIVAAECSKFPVEDWDEAFEPNNERCREAIAEIDQRMAALGLRL
jgi:hypothetical protein